MIIFVSFGLMSRLGLVSKSCCITILVVVVVVVVAVGVTETTIEADAPALSSSTAIIVIIITVVIFLVFLGEISVLALTIAVSGICGSYVAKELNSSSGGLLRMLDIGSYQKSPIAFGLLFFSFWCLRRRKRRRRQ